MKNYLYHHGIQGMRWGVRRYQNKDGSLTKAGEDRYYKYEGDHVPDLESGKMTRDQVKDPRRWRGEDLSQNRRFLSDTGSAMRSASNDLDSIRIKKKQNPRLDLSRMTDKDLQRAINREQLERSYNSLFNSDVAETSVEKGKRYASETLKTTGTILGLAASAVTIAMSINQLKMDKFDAY